MQFEETAFWLSEIMPVTLDLRQVDSRRVGTGVLEDGRSLAATLDFSEVDSGLVMQDGSGTDVRCELMTTARVTEAEAAAVVLAAASLIDDASGLVPAQPGIMLPGLAERAGLTGMSVAHGLLIPPRLWGGQTPHVNEEGRMTLMLEVAMITDEEHGIGVEAGVDKLLRRLTRRGADLDDWRRE